MRILVEQSGYELENVGDLAMLEAGLAQIARVWPKAEVCVVADHDGFASPDGLAVRTVRPLLRTNRLPIPAVLRRALALRWKRYGPDVLGRLRAVDTLVGRHATGLLGEVVRADVIVSTGGGFINDVFPMHAASILALLRAGQRRGVPTAMFGQGIGPLAAGGGRSWGRTVDRLTVLGLREPTSVQGLRSLGATRKPIVTGDEALLLADAGHHQPVEEGIGVNIRLQGYSGGSGVSVPALRSALAGLADRLGGPLVALPITHTHPGSDVEAIAHLVAGGPIAPLTTPGQLAAAVRRCRIVVTGSYHAAVFALAQGVPVIGLSASAYYDAKFAGLGALFPSGAIQTVRLDASDWESSLSEHAMAAWLGQQVDGGDTAAVSLGCIHSCERLWTEFAGTVCELEPA